jgi:hypothetical protein
MESIYHTSREHPIRVFDVIAVFHKQPNAQFLRSKLRPIKFDLVWGFFWLRQTQGDKQAMKNEDQIQHVLGPFLIRSWSSLNDLDLQ